MKTRFLFLVLVLWLVAPATSVRAAVGTQPPGSGGAISGSSTNPAQYAYGFRSGPVTQTTRTNAIGFSTSTTVSNFVFGPSSASLTNMAAGFFYVDAGFNYYAVSNDTMKVMIATNGVIASSLIGYSDYKTDTAGGSTSTNFVKVSGIVYLPANSYVQVYSDWAESTAQTIQIYLSYVNAFSVSLGSIGGSGNGTVDPTNVVLVNIIGTGAITNKPNQWTIHASPEATNVYFAENRAIDVALHSNDFSGLLQGIADRGVDGFSIKVSPVPFYTNAYVFSNSVTFTNWGTIYGDSAGNPTVVFRAAPSFSGALVKLGTPTVRIGGISGWRDIRFEGDQGATNVSGVEIVNVVEPLFDFCEFTGFKLAGIHVNSTNSTYWTHVARSWFVQKFASAHGILFSQTPIDSYTAINQFNVWNCTFGMEAGSGITVSNYFPGIAAQGNKFFSVGPETHGFGAYAGGRFTVQGNSFQNFGVGYPIYLYDRASATNYYSDISDNQMNTSGPLLVVGDFIGEVQHSGNRSIGGDPVFLTGNNSTVFGFDSTGLRFADDTLQTTAGISISTLNTSSNGVLTAARANDTTTSNALFSAFPLRIGTNASPSTYTNLQFVSPANTVVSNAGNGTAAIHINASSGGGTNFPNVNLLLGNTNLTLSAGVRKAFHNQTNGSHGINLNLAVPESGYVVTYSVSNSSSSDITVTFYTNSVAANPYDIATKTNVNTFTASASAITQVELKYLGAGIWVLESIKAPATILKFGSGITATTNGVNNLDVTISASGGGVSSATNFATGVDYVWNGNAGAWSGAGGFWSINEEFLGDASSGTHGVNYFSASTTGGGAVTVAGGEIGAPGVLSLVTTNTGDRSGIYQGAGSLNSIRPTNIMLTAVMRVQAGTVGGDIETFRIGLGNSLSADGSAGIYIRHTNGVWQAMTSVSSTHTTANASNVTAGEWTWFGFHLDATGTNVVFYQGGTDRTMTPFATNIANIPHSAQISPIVVANRYAGTTSRQTNKLDVFRMRFDRVP